MNIGLATHTSLGCTLNGKDLLYSLDYPISTVLPSLAKKEQIKNIKADIATNIKYLPLIEGVITLAEEIHNSFTNIQEDLQQLNNKYAHLKFGTTNFVNPFRNAIIKALREVYPLTSYHAKLSVDSPELFNKLEEAFDYIITFSKQDRTTPLPNYTMRTFGLEGRTESVFDRVVHHYTQRRQQCHT